MSAATPPPPYSSGGPPHGKDTAAYPSENGGRGSNRSSYGTPVDGSRHIDDLCAEAVARARAMGNLPVYFSRESNTVEKCLD